MSSVKSRVQTLLRRVGVYERVKASRLYDLYWAVADGGMLAERRTEVDFYLRLLQGFRKGDLIFDVGANQGAKTDIFLRIGGRVLAVEPDEVNQGVLKKKFLEYRWRPRPVAVVAKAVSDTESVTTMWVDAPGSAKNTLSEKWVTTLRGDSRRFGECLDFNTQRRVETVTLDRLIDEHGVPFFVKIDVEGFEPAVLRGLHRRVRYLSFEVNLPEFRLEGLECVALLSRIAADGRFNYAADCQRGLMLADWLDGDAFSEVFGACDDPSVEVFWKTPPSPPR